MPVVHSGAVALMILVASVLGIFVRRLCVKVCEWVCLFMALDVAIDRSLPVACLG